MTEFTKGKWEVVQGAGIDEFDVFSKDAPLHNHICVLFGYPVSRWNEQKANARLIAAAPEMYEALQETLDFIEDIIGRKCPECTQDAEDMREFLEELLARIDGTEATHD